VTPEPGRVLAIDLGEARIGLALSDPLGLTAQPLQTLSRVGLRRDLQYIAEIVGQHDVNTVVLGLPRLLSGEEGSAAEAARAFGRRLEGRLPGVALELWDERLTTALAERTMISGRVRRARRKKKVDALAALLILQSFLDARSESRR
jgi:putative Holliday junction resolvase